MIMLEFKNVRIFSFIIRTILVLAVASAAGEWIFHLQNGWHTEIAFWRIITESLLIIFVFTPLLWIYVLRPLRQMTEAASRKTELELLSLMEATLESTADGIVVLNMALQVVRYNQKYIQMWGKIGAQAFALRDAHKIFEQIKGMLTDPDLFLQQSLRAYGDQDRSYNDEVRFKDGRIFERYSQPQKIDGVIVGWVSSYRDITEKRLAEEALRDSEERFKQIVEQSDDSLFLCTSDCLIVDMNRSAVDLFGYDKVELLNQSLQILFDSDRYRLLCYAIDSNSANFGCRVEKISAKCKDGNVRFVSIRVKVIELSGEALLIFSINDISDKVRMEEHTRDIQAKLIQANKMTSLGLLVSGIAHEINNPNNYIMISSELVSRVWKDCLPVLNEYREMHGDFMVGGVAFSSFQTEAEDLIGGITDGSRRIREIVNSLKDFSRDNKGLQEGDVDVNRVINKATTIIAHHIKRTTNRFELQLAPRLPCITGNKHQLEQVVINVVLNALQSLASPDASVKVTTSYETRSREVLIIVEDQGIGIKDEISSMIMEPFFTTKFDSGGSGLGLSICRTIMHEHNGTINFETESGKGTIFTLRLPVNSRLLNEVIKDDVFPNTDNPAC